MVVEAATRMVERVRSAAMPDEVREQLHGELRVVLWNSSKLVSFASGARWEPEQVDALGKGGEAAYEEFAVRHGILAESSAKREHRTAGEFRQKLLGLLEEERWEARPMIHALLRYAPSRLRQRIEPIAELTERLTMGELEWAAYKSEILQQLEGVSE